MVREKLPYDPARDLVPISSATDSFGTIAVPTSLNIASLAQLVAHARARPGKLNSYGSAGVFPYLLAGFLQSEGLEVTQISYREQTLAMQDLGEGRLDLLMTVIGAILPVAQAGKAKFLAVTNSKRSLTVPEVPTVTEAGCPELAFEGFQGFFGPRGISAELRDRIAADVAAVAADPVVVARLDAMGQLAHATTPTEFAGMPSTRSPTRRPTRTMPAIAPPTRSRTHSTRSCTTGSTVRRRSRTAGSCTPPMH